MARQDENASIRPIIRILLDKTLVQEAYSPPNPIKMIKASDHKSANPDRSQSAPSKRSKLLPQPETESNDASGDPTGGGESDEEETEPRVENPSTNIRGDLEKIISSANESFKGSYHFEDQCDAPNPTLRLTAGNIGTIGLPLAEVAAKQIMKHSKQVSFAPGERSAAGKKTRDTWDMDGELIMSLQVKFDNPRWDSFISNLAMQVYMGLGIKFSASKPKIELYKLLLYGAGSHFLPHQYTEKAEGIFATMIVTLPSAFTGGAIHLSHAGLPAVIDSSADSLLSTSVAAWYTGVTHEFKPVISGYRLALSYNLIHTTDAPRPSLPATYGPLTELRHVLLSWKQGGHSGPRKIICLLQEMYYSATALRDSKGADAHLVSFLGAVAKELGFKLGMAKAQLTLSGAACDSGDYRGCAYDYYDSDEDEDDDVEFAEDPDRDMKITKLVDL
ncbi:hypothetical protein BOTBODRAFT_174147 [Botryobasidium botryosum FD-172 SS1]|uniref:Fe2OG dioxygenase domain-containing protein n=1 Tax=Botryobasidium botryosum (strain FD-172 SS1) TaxID=930990 RepID=A0A067MUU0_BOTB1|nr:hypothetical protein BOTBODRAFT_174147 [Botryobasidium botryosum FD-172 SS1]